MKKEIPVKQLTSARTPTPLPLSSKSNYENFHFVKDEACFLHNVTECSKGGKNSFEQSEPYTICFFDISNVWAVIL